MNEYGNIVKFENKIYERNGAARPSIGLALGSGAMRGFAHLGVISEFLENKIIINEISGSSTGAIMACVYASGINLKEAESIGAELSETKLFDYRVPFVSLYKGVKLRKFLSDVFLKRLKIKRLEHLKTKVFVVCVDIYKGRPVVFKTGDIIDVLMASSAVPILFPPVEFCGSTYIDGGILMPLPASLLKNRGNDAVVAVNLGFSNNIKKFSHIIHICAQSIITMGSKLIEAQKKEANFVIEPDFGDIGFWNFSKIKDVVLAGRKAAAQSIDKIYETVAKLKSNRANHIRNVQL